MNNENPFHQWIRLEQPRLGTRVVYATDDFFGSKERLIDAPEPIWIEDKYDDNGKWMDGWESRRKRVAGYDHCIVRLGIPGVIHGFNISTHFFTGNYAPAASVDACVSTEDHPGDDADWITLLPREELAGNTNNFFAVKCVTAVSHLRLNIYPDGGVARLRVYGEVRADETVFEQGKTVDLLSMKNGGRALCCSDEHYGSMHNVNLPDLGTHMGDGWETARRRGPGYDWVVFELGKPGIVSDVEIDTAYFKGNYPDRAEVRAALITDTENIATASENWPVLVAESKLQMDEAKTFTAAQDVGPVSHVRLNIFPDGGVSRFRVRGVAID